MKIAVKIILLVTLLFIGMIADSIGPVMTNDLAMTQMSNSDAVLVAMNTYNQIRPIISITYGVIICLMLFWIARDLVKFAKST